MMIADINIQKVQSENLERDEIVVCSIDMVLLLTDFEIFKSLVRSPGRNLVKNIDLYETMDDFAIQPIIFDRKHKNILEWILYDDLKNNIKNTIGIEKYYEDYINSTSDKIYENAEPSDLARSLPILFKDKRLKEFYITCSPDERRKNAQLKALVNLLGPYAYRLKVIQLEKEETLVDAIISNNINCTSIYYDDIFILKEAEEKGLDMSNLCFMISDLSYNYKLSEVRPDTAILKLDPNYYQDKYGTGLGMQELKRFDNEKYFAFG